MKLKNILRQSELDFFQDQEKTDELLQDIKQKFIQDEIKLTFWKVEYNYKTKRGNKKSKYHYFIAGDGEEAKGKFINYIKNISNLYPYRAYLNVEILKCVSVGSSELLIS
jgi:hypothetical protein